MLPLEKYGIKIHHDDVGAASDGIVKQNDVHKTAQFFSVGGPVNFWRIEARTEKDFDWFEHKYPGCSAKRRRAGPATARACSTPSAR